MAYDPTDDVTARALLEDAIALTSQPTLSTAQVDRAFALASSLDDAGNVVYLAADLNKAAAWCWNVKAGMASDQYDLGGGPGKTLTRSQLQAQCLAIAGQYAIGVMNVVPGTVPARVGIRTLGMVGSNVDPTTLINTVVPG